MEAVPRGGHVVVRVGWASGTGARIEVEDDGPGLPNVSAPIFEPFYTTKPQGTGLGLAIAHRIVSDHGGTINVASRPGKTVFSITLPGSEKPAQAELLTH
jgi:signal transduction histidine kinase